MKRPILGKVYEREGKVIYEPRIHPEIIIFDDSGMCILMDELCTMRIARCASRIHFRIMMERGRRLVTEKILGCRSRDILGMNPEITSKEMSSSGSRIRVKIYRLPEVPKYTSVYVDKTREVVIV